MNRFYLLAIITVAMFLLGGCAATYTRVNPKSLTYYAHDMQDGIDFSYKYDVLREVGNRKYANKETKRGVKLVAVKITNYSDTTINVARDLVFYSGQIPIMPLEPSVTKAILRQIVPAYLPYALLTFTTLTTTNTTQNGGYTSTDTHAFPIGIFLGPGITIGNMAVAASANKNLLAELNEYNILGTEIRKGETRYGLFGIRDAGYNPLTVKRRK